MITNRFKLKRFLLSALITTVFLVLSFILPSSALADEEEQGFARRFRFGTFGTLGLVYDSSDFHLQRDLGQPDTFHGRYSLLLDSLIGAQVDFKVMDRLDATVQMVAKERPEQTLEESLEWAFLRWSPDDNLMIRAGRLGLDLYLLSDYRNVGYAYLWQRPVVEFYNLLWINNFDGGDISYRFRLGNGNMQAKLFGGVMHRSIELVRAKGANDFEYSMIGGKVSYENENLRISAGYGHTTILNNMKDSVSLMNPLLSVTSIWPQAAAISDRVSSKNKMFNFFSVGASYEDKDWVIQGEFGYLESNWSSLPSTLSGYLSVGHHFDDFTPYIVLAAVKSVGSTAYNPPPPVTGDKATDAGLTTLYNAASSFTKGIRVDQRTISLGLRWDFYHNMAMKFQWDLSEVGAAEGGLWWKPVPASLSEKTYVNLLSTSLNFAF